MHSAKGLEFPVVFLFDLSDEVIPHIKSRDTEEDDLLQERKLFLCEYDSCSRPIVFVTS